MPKTKEKKKSPKRKSDKKSAQKVQKQALNRDALFDALVELARHYRTELAAALSDLDIYPGQEQLLLALHKAGPLPPSQLADALNVRPPTITKMVSRLSANDLVVKTKLEEDGRMVVIALTENARTLMKKLEKRKAGVEKSLLKGLSKDESKSLRTMLEKTNAALLLQEPS